MALSRMAALREDWRRHGLMQLVLRSRLLRPLIGRASEIIYWHSYAWAGTTWMGVPAMKYPADAWSYQEIIFETKPDLIIETGTNRGGSALFLAHMLDLVANGRVITIDIEDMSGRPAHPRITYIVASSVDAGTVQRVRHDAADARRVMVILDSDHSADHVFKELVAYAPIVTPGCYLICEDTNVNGHPVHPKHGPGPLEALRRFLPAHPEFERDRNREHAGMTSHPGGFLRRRQSVE